MGLDQIEQILRKSQNKKPTPTTTDKPNEPTESNDSTTYDDFNSNMSDLVSDINSIAADDILVEIINM